MKNAEISVLHRASHEVEKTTLEFKTLSEVLVKVGGSLCCVKKKLWGRTLRLHYHTEARKAETDEGRI